MTNSEILQLADELECTPPHTAIQFAKVIARYCVTVAAGAESEGRLASDAVAQVLGLG